MRTSYILPVCVLLTAGLFVSAQSSKDLITELQSINQSVAAASCNTDSAAAISRRAMNVFLADKTGYLSGNRDLSFYTNYVTINTSEGKFTVNHNFQSPGGVDDPIKKLLSIGFDMTVANSYAKSFSDRRFENELGITVNYKWLGRVKTCFADCAPAANTIGQKQAMNALRATLIEQIKIEILQKENDFTTALNHTDSVNTAEKMVVKQDFYTELKNTYEEKFITAQAALLTRTNNFKRISTHWTSLTAYIPLLFATYTTAASFNAAFGNRHPYPFNITVGHTRMWELATKGRLFCTLEANLLFNNSKLSYGLSKMNFSEYKALGGTAAADPGSNHLYIGTYKKFITPSLSARVVYFPANSHVGLCVLAEQNLGDYKLLNCRLGIPIVLINSKKTPAVNIECYVLFLNLAKASSTMNGSSAGLSIGIPFSRLMY